MYKKQYHDTWLLPTVKSDTTKYSLTSVKIQMKQLKIEESKANYSSVLLKLEQKDGTHVTKGKAMHILILLDRWATCTTTTKQYRQEQK